MDKIGDIRRAYFEQHRPIKEIVRTLSVSHRRGSGRHPNVRETGLYQIAATITTNGENPIVVNVRFWH